MPSEFRSEGTVVRQNGKTYWFKKDGIQGEEVPLLHAIDLVEGILGRKLNAFESNLLISWPRNGGTSITIVSKLVMDTSERNYLKSIKPVVIGYAVRHREKPADEPERYTHITGVDAFCDTDGNAFGKVNVTYPDEPANQTSLMDPIDFISGGLAGIIRNGGKAALRGAVAGAERGAMTAAERGAMTGVGEGLLARGATGELAKLATLTTEDLKAIRGGALSVKPPLISATELNKPVQQIKAGMGPRQMLTGEERIGVIKIGNVLERVRANPADLSPWADLTNHVVKKMEFGNYAKEGWIEIYVLEKSKAAAYWANRMRVIFRAVKGDMEAKIVQMH
jgi:hypothetical protein